MATGIDTHRPLPDNVCTFFVPTTHYPGRASVEGDGRYPATQNVKNDMKTRFLISIFLVLMVALPAFAYGDPTGGMLFQMLTPILAMLWGLWMIFANAIRRGTANFVRKFRKVEAPDDPMPDDQTS